MFCFFNWGGESGRAPSPVPGASAPAPTTTWPPEDASISDLSSDGKYEIEIPKDFPHPEDEIRFIDSEKDNESIQGCGETRIQKNIQETGIQNSDSDAQDDGSGQSDLLVNDCLDLPARINDLYLMEGGTKNVDDEDTEELSAISAAEIAQMMVTDSPLAGRSPAPGPRFKLLHEGDIHVCHLRHPRTVLDKFGSKFLRRWETHHLHLNHMCISSKTPVGFLESPLPYSSMEEVEVYSLARWDASHEHCLRIVVPDGSLLLQAKNAYTRDQWYHSIQWKRNLYRYSNTLSHSTKQEVILKELKSMVDFVMSTPLQDECITSEPLQIITQLLAEEQRWTSDSSSAVEAAGPLLACAPLPAALCASLGRYCRQHPHCPRLQHTLGHVARRILKHNVDFGKSPHLRRLVQDYISALNRQPYGETVVRLWVSAVHGGVQVCPHPRVLPNLAAACLAALHSPPPNSQSTEDFTEKHQDKTSKQLFHITENMTQELSDELNQQSKDLIDLNSRDSSYDDQFDENEDGQHHITNDCFTPLSGTTVSMHASPGELLTPDDETEPKADDDGDQDLVCFAKVIQHMSTYPDWAAGLGALLQPVPVPSALLTSGGGASRALAHAAGALGRDPRCAVHRRVLPLRESRPGWFQLLCPTRPGATDASLHIWGDMLGTLLNCCCKRKRFLTELASEMLPACILLALRAHPAGLETLCLMLEWEVLEEEQARVEAAQALSSTPSGRRALKASCQRQVHLKKLQQKGGPRRLTLPSRATDADVTRLLSNGSFGNLECLSLAFTHVTSAVAEELIKLPSLRYLNLWATQFGDAGVLLIAEHLQRLQVLNLCETPVSDTGITALAALTNLRKLNLNSTKLTAATWTRLRPRLPHLQEADVRYTDAW